MRLGKLEIKITGENICPESYDIREVISMCENVERLLYLENKEKQNRPTISYRIESGSVQQTFTTEDSPVLKSFGEILNIMQESQSLKYIESKEPDKANIFASIQKKAKEKKLNYQFLVPNTRDCRLIISPETNFLIESLWYDSEDYFYGIIQSMGGKKKGTIHLDTEEHGILFINCDKKILSKLDHNILYQKKLIYARCKLDWKTHKLKKDSLKFIDFYEYTPVPDWKELKNAMEIITKDLDKKYPTKDNETRDPIQRMRYIRGYDPIDDEIENIK